MKKNEMQMLCKKLNKMDLSPVSLWALATCDQGGLEYFLGCDTAEEVEELVKEIHGEDIVDRWLDFIDGTIEATESGFRVETWTESWDYTTYAQVIDDAFYTVNEWMKEGVDFNEEF